MLGKFLSPSAPIQHHLVDNGFSHFSIITVYDRQTNGQEASTNNGIMLNNAQ